MGEYGMAARPMDKTLPVSHTAFETQRMRAGQFSHPDDPELARDGFIEPTVFADVTPSMRIFREEIFGPVLSVIKWRDENELIKDVNSVEYGLSASIYTRDLARAHRLAKRIEAGYIWINTSSAHYTGANFGGYKKSGLGREEGLDELLSYTQVKNVHVAL